jgi:hypothetical protein
MDLVRATDAFEGDPLEILNALNFTAMTEDEQAAASTRHAAKVRYVSICPPPQRRWQWISIILQSVPCRPAKAFVILGYGNNKTLDQFKRLWDVIYNAVTVCDSDSVIRLADT